MLNWVPLGGSILKFWSGKSVNVENYAQSSDITRSCYRNGPLWKVHSSYSTEDVTIITSTSKRYASRQSQAFSSKCNGSGVTCFIRSINFMSQFKKPVAQFDETAAKWQYETLDDRTTCIYIRKIKHFSTNFKNVVSCNLTVITMKLYL